MSTNFKFELSHAGEQMAYGGLFETPEEERRLREIRATTNHVASLLEQMEEAQKEEGSARLVSQLHEFFASQNKQKQLMQTFCNLLDAKPCSIDLDARHVDDNNRCSYNLLHLAATLGLFDVVKKLVEMKAPIDSVCEKGTALCLAIEHGHPAIAQWLLDQGASPHYTAPSKMERDHFRIYASTAPMIIATREGNEKMIARLYDLGASVNDCTPDHDGALYQTNWKDNVSAARLLIRYGAQPNHGHSKHTAFSTVLNAAALHSTAEYLTTLLDAGADMYHPSQSTGALSESREQMLTRTAPVHQHQLKILEDRNTQAQQRWEEIRADRSNLRGIKMLDFIYCANIGKLDALLALPGWRSARDHLGQLLSQLPPWMTEHVAQRHPSLMQAAASAADWCTRVAAPDPFKIRGRE